MKDTKILIIVVVAVISGLLLIPTITGKEVSWFPSHKINLGLDLRGGMQIVLQVEVDKAVRDELGRIGQQELPDKLKEESVTLKKAYVSDTADKLIVEFNDENDRNKARTILEAQWKQFTIEDTRSAGGPALALGMQKEVIAGIRENALKQARQMIDNRINEFGVAEPEIYTSGGEQIIVRLPGVVDPGRAKQLIGRTAVLEFKLLTDKAICGPTKDELLRPYGGQPPEGYATYARVAKKSSSDESGYCLLRKTPDFAGSYLTDARMGFGQYQEPEVEFQFNQEGARKFGELTGANIGKQLAIVLDNQIYSAPVINSRISSRGQITGSFTPEDAQDLAIVLRAGALPVPVRIEEERTVGATLGEDSIHRGTVSFIVGGLAVVFFMALYYRTIGFSANLALVLNVAMVLGGMAALGATLTMPGIAGIILTVGMAVDANVIINERVREELRLGKSPPAAVRVGYDRALWTILDSHATGLIAAAFLYEFGTGPVKGFGVTLIIGLISSVFTAIVITRVIADRLAARSRDTLSI
jgi:preprotein translocase subunit SecD